MLHPFPNQISFLQSSWKATLLKRHSRCVCFASRFARLLKRLQVVAKYKGEDSLSQGSEDGQMAKSQITEENLQTTKAISRRKWAPKGSSKKGVFACINSERGACSTVGEGSDMPKVRQSFWSNRPTIHIHELDLDFNLKTFVLAK